MFSNIYVELYHCASIPAVRSSAVHNTGLVVFIWTTGSSGSRWLDVDNNPSNEDSCSVRFHRRPVVVRTVESIPNGSSPHVLPRTS